MTVGAESQGYFQIYKKDYFDDIRFRVWRALGPKGASPQSKWQALQMKVVADFEGYKMSTKKESSDDIS